MRRRLLAAMVGLTVFILVVHDVPLIGHLRNVERDRLITQLEIDAFLIAGRSTELLEVLSESGTADVSTLDRLVTEYSEETKGRVVVTDRRGLVIAATDGESVVGRDFSSRPEVKGALAGAAETGQRFSQTLTVDLLYVAVPVIVGEEVVGSVRITYPASVIDDRVTSRMWGIFVAAIVSIVVAVIVSVLLTFTVTRPLDRLTAITEKLGDEDFSATAEEDSGPPEIRALALSFNRMKIRLQRLVEKQKNFASDASHQLRTPLTALQLRLEQAHELAARDPSLAKSRIEDALVESDRLHQLVNGLLALARAEARSDTPVEIDMVAVAVDRIASWTALSAESGVRFVPTVDARPRVTVIAGALEQILDNFIDNAVQYSPRGSIVDVRIELKGDLGVLTVADRGPGLSAEQCERAVDRFWRAPNARPGGTGLGLAIASRLAEASGGSIALEPREGGGLVARLSLPLAR